MSNVLQRDPICSCPQLNPGHARSRMMKIAIMVSSFSSQRHMNNTPGESGYCAASPNDVYHRCRWQGNGQILVLHGELQQELAQFPEAGRTSCFMSGLVRHARRYMGPIGPSRTERPQPIGNHRSISTALQGDITHLGIVHRPSQNVPSSSPDERPMPSQNAAAAHTRMCVLHREKGQCAPTPLKQHSAAWGRLRENRAALLLTATRSTLQSISGYMRSRYMSRAIYI